LHGEGVRSPAGVRQRAQPDGQRSLRRCPQGERSESIPLSPPHSEEKPERKFRLFFCILHGEGVRSPAGFDSGRSPMDSGACDAARRVSEANQSPSHRHIPKKSLNESSGFFLHIARRGVRSPAGVRKRAQPDGQRNLPSTIRKPGRSRVWALHFYSIEH